MKVGGNESATKYFRANGGSAALASKDPKTKYQSAAATKYKEELKKRAARDALEFPDEVVITDATDADDASTPASEPNDDFFSSWDKPSIKRPTPPISRTATPPVVGRTPSPFLNANANGKDISRSASPLSKTESSEAKPAASRITTSAALRKTATGGAGPRKTNVLGAKKATKLGAKKVTGDIIDFDEAEKKAKEEADRIAKLGYDPEAEETATKKPAAASKAEAPNAASPAPASPAAYGSGHSRQKSAAEVERLGMGFGRLGFGQVGGGKAAAPAAKKNMGGFGSVGPVKAAAEGKGTMFIGYMYLELTNSQMIASAMPVTSSAPRRVSHQMSSSAREPSTPMRRPRPKPVCKDSKALQPFRRTLTLDDPRTRSRSTTTAIWRLLPRISFASSASLLVTTWRT